MGEFLLDLVHSTYPTYDRLPWESYAYWEKALEAPLEVLLALESEWGFQTDPQRNFASVMADASKIAAVRARSKVMLFAAPGKGEKFEENRARLLQALRNLRKRADDKAP